MDQSKVNNSIHNYYCANESRSLITNESSDSLVMNVDTLPRNGALKLAILSQFPAQCSSSVFPNRKRRYRKSQEISDTNSRTICSTTNTNGEIEKNSDLSCVVCCAVAHGYNFDTISCESCKAFFRRNALFNTDRLKCRRDGACEISVETRRRCKSCRLKKCFAVGMRKEWILTEEEKVTKKRRIVENRRTRASDTNDDAQPKDMIRKYNSDSQTIFINKKENSRLKSKLYNQNSSFISNIATAYNDRIKLDLTGYGWSYPLTRKITGLYQIINAKTTTALRLISFYKRLYDFDVLNEIDKVNLIKSNLHYILFFHASLKYDPIHDVYHEENTNDKPLYGAHIREAYGIDTYIRCTKLIRSLYSIVQMDKYIMPVVLVIFLFSKGLSVMRKSNESFVNNYQQIFQIQNKYAEQLWLFIEKNYGNVQVVRIFSSLITRCLLIQEFIRDIEHDIYEKFDPCQVPPILRSLIQTP
ncbi:unnamed protein product [Rotaria magnacalcarata]|uniref:Nuclear receptor domain-containing protein n=3 Tax=Rotaria magnacalcarata TaxID=392030 RepID=A0A815X2F8_9BILA|nr:unnamed protein product [Rotaria magnacalcarata]